MSKQIKIYPDILVETIGDQTRIETYLRIQREEKWYLSRMTYHHYFNKDKDLKEQIFIFMKTFLFNVHVNLTLQQIDMNTTDVWGKPLIQLDPDQRTEKERLLSKLPNKASV